MPSWKDGMDSQLRERSKAKFKTKTKDLLRFNITKYNGRYQDIDKALMHPFSRHPGSPRAQKAVTIQSVRYRGPRKRITDCGATDCPSSGSESELPSHCGIDLRDEIIRALHNQVQPVLFWRPDPWMESHLRVPCRPG